MLNRDKNALSRKVSINIVYGFLKMDKKIKCKNHTAHSVRMSRIAILA